MCSVFILCFERLVPASCRRQVQRAAAGALRTLAFKNEENKNQIVECGALPTLIHMLRAEDAGIHYEAVGVIGNLVHSSIHIKRQARASRRCTCLLIEICLHEIPFHRLHANTCTICRVSPQDLAEQDAAARRTYWHCQAACSPAVQDVAIM